MTKKLAINQWAEEGRSRDNMLLHGASVLSNAELLAILIGSGSAESSAVELMRKVLEDCNNRLGELGKRTDDELCRDKGIGPAKAITILAASELGRRREDEEPSERKQLRCSNDSYVFLHAVMCDLAVEECWVLLLNQASTDIEPVKISQGGWASTQVDIRCILREAFL